MKPIENKPNMPISTFISSTALKVNDIYSLQLKSTDCKGMFNIFCTYIPYFAVSVGNLFANNMT